MKSECFFRIKVWLFMTIVSLFVPCLTACSDADGDLMKEKDVLKAVAATVPTEQYEYVRVEHHEDITPKEDIYYFKSKERDMTFQALSTLRPFGLDASTMGYSQKVFSGYADGVHSLYTDEIEDILSKIPTNDKGDYCYDSYAELEEILKTIVEADSVYKAEKAYNTEEWMEENPLTTITLNYRYKNEAGEEKKFSMFGIALNGSLDYERIYKLYSYYHVNKICENGLTDDTIPEEAYAMVHSEKLSDIYIDGYNVSEAAYVDDKADRLNNVTREKNGNDNYAAYYYYPWDCYVVAINPGLTSDENAPRLIEHYTDALGIKCEVQYKKGIVKWSSDNGKWRISASQDDDNNIVSCVFEKYGNNQEIKYITCDDYLSPIHSTYLVGISVDDFADIFGIKYEINEDEGMVKFYRDKVYR